MSVKRPSFEKDEIENAINIAPLIDIIFILLLFFIVTMVFSDRTVLSIKSPQASQSEVVRSDNLTVSISEEGKFYFKSSMMSLSELEKNLSETSFDEHTKLIIEADSKVSVDILVSLMDSVKKVGLENIYISTDKVDE